jgi:predicted component of type VI protein secretion system
MQAKLIVVEPEIHPSQYDLMLPMTIGRGRDSRLKLMHALVSRRHCELFEDAGKLMVRDLGSLNGTFVGGERVETASVPPGGLLTIGSVTFRAVYGDDASLATGIMQPIDGDTTSDTLRLEETTDAEAFIPPAQEVEPWGFEDKQQPPLALMDESLEESAELRAAEDLTESSDELSLADSEIPPLRLVDEDSLPVEPPEMDIQSDAETKPINAGDERDLDSWFDSLELEDESKKPEKE